MLNKSAKILSVALHPCFIPIYIMVVLLFLPTMHSYYPLRVKGFLIWSVALYTLIMPALTMALIKRLQRLHRRRLSKREFTAIAILICAICYVLYALTMMRSPSLTLFRKMAIVGMSCGLFSLATLPFSRISLHLTGMGAAVALFVMLNILGENAMFWALLVTIILAGLLASARLYMGRNRSRQLLAGFVGGFVICMLVMLWL